jgi:acetyl-CoA carboxylase biotin carboxyl carrier protein
MSESTKTIPSPLPGVFYRRPRPEEPPFVEEGQRVKKGEPIGLVEVMKNFYEIHADDDGVLARFLVKDQEVIDAGQPVAEVKTK